MHGCIVFEPCLPAGGRK